MRRYVRAGLIVDDGCISATATEVLVEDDAPRYIGLVAADGTPLYSVSDREPAGFKLGRAK